MKRFSILLILLLTVAASQAQLFKKADSTVQEQYAAGTVPVINGKVTFEEVIPAEGYSAAEVSDIVNAWIKERYVEPTVISVKHFDSGVPGTTVIKGEEYIVFKNTFFVLSRARTYYFLTLTANDGSCTFNMSRITYWYDDEDDKGGIKMKAEEWITDDNALNKKGKMKKFEGKFRSKTIDLKNILVSELTERLKK
ncbi:MAG: DUF4468 domain-containing protein [Bacteroidaceae bacterium]|nr:DUF4468 domain-containing protein [Bacteroidaceae bacterium]